MEGLEIAAGPRRVQQVLFVVSSAPVPFSASHKCAQEQRILQGTSIEKHIVGEQASCFAHVADPAQDSPRRLSRFWSPSGADGTGPSP